MAVAVTLASCSNDDDITTGGTPSPSFGGLDNKEVAFTTNLGAVSRGATSITSLDKFCVYGILNDNGTKSMYMRNVPFSLQGTYFKSADTNVKYYWPTSGKLTFYAFYPQPDNDMNEYLEDEAYPCYDLNGTEDVVYAKSDEVSYAPVVPLKFNHAMSQIHLRLQQNKPADGLEYKVASVKLCSPQGGTFDLSVYGAKQPWLPVSTSKPVTWTEDFPATISNGNSVTAEEFFMSTPFNRSKFPDSDVYFLVDYQVYQNGVMVENHSGANAVRYDISDNWNAGTSYIYTLKFQSSSAGMEIIFSSEIADWTTDNKSVIL